jgi:hypothetical protein
MSLGYARSISFPRLLIEHEQIHPRNIWNYRKGYMKVLENNMWSTVTQPIIKFNLNVDGLWLSDVIAALGDAPDVRTLISRLATRTSTSTTPSGKNTAVSHLLLRCNAFVGPASRSKQATSWKSWNWTSVATTTTKTQRSFWTPSVFRKFDWTSWLRWGMMFLK